jgi:hypothetical protein
MGVDSGYFKAPGRPGERIGAHSHAGTETSIGNYLFGKQKVDRRTTCPLAMFSDPLCSGSPALCY